MIISDILSKKYVDLGPVWFRNYIRRSVLFFSVEKAFEGFKKVLTCFNKLLRDPSISEERYVLTVA